jgi:hypothetical protein
VSKKRGTPPGVSARAAAAAAGKVGGAVGIVVTLFFVGVVCFVRVSYKTKTLSGCIN